jgi:DNA recombination protein RmuC
MQDSIQSLWIGLSIGLGAGSLASFLLFLNYKSKLSGIQQQMTFERDAWNKEKAQFSDVETLYKANTQKIDALQQKLHEEDLVKNRLENEKEFLEMMRTALETDNQALGVSKEQQSQRLLDLEKEKISLETELNGLQNKLKEFKDSFESEWGQKFETLSLKTLQVVKEELHVKAVKEYEEKQTQLNQNLTTLLEPLTKMIQEHEKKVEQLEKQTITEATTLKTQIELSMTQVKELVAAKDKIVAVLTDNKGRGDWGEMQLLRMLENSGLVKDRDYVFQPVNEDDSRPDVMIHLPNQHVLYIDVKTLLGTLTKTEIALEEARDPEERKKLTQSLRTEILRLDRKAYQSKNKASVDFVILYVPRESMLRVPLEEFPTLMEEAYEKGIILSSPLILMGLLKTIAQGWTQHQMTENAREIQHLGRELHKRAVRFLERFDDIGKTLESASHKFDEAKKSLDGRAGLLPQLKKLEDFGCKSEKNMPSQYKFSDEDIRSEVLVPTLDLISTKP